MKLIYPACVYRDESNNGWEVDVPDIKGCVCKGATLSDALVNAIGLATATVATALENGEHSPAPRDPASILPEPGGFINMIMVDINAYSLKIGEAYISRELKIPRWLNNFCEARKVDVNDVLLKTLTDLYERSQTTEADITCAPKLDAV
ncbi:MAG: type II toxin-antitoxin system HicB family antitoxin [Clostridiales bacterium]|jgi:predicted RNase H-like HicB family nuclease|nr:type II toxin-antitoxin system HicB family antitoxin [Clostridiales bacterium]